ncbi:hypothetical protein MKW92_007799 [Papaver armeniacum]|nr:hypothetical protein MKW92_007799 [Papaver armeniacum]
MDSVMVYDSLGDSYSIPEDKIVKGLDFSKFADCRHKFDEEETMKNIDVDLFFECSRLFEEAYARKEALSGKTGDKEATAEEKKRKSADEKNLPNQETSSTDTKKIKMKE